MAFGERLAMPGSATAPPSATSPVASRSVRRTDWLALGLFCVLPALFFWQGLLDPASIIREDAASFFQPYYTFAADEVRAGRLPLWNPFSNLGLPFHASLQAALFYPLRWPLFFMSYVAGHLLLLWTHYALTAAAAYVFMRAALAVGPLAATLGAISIAYGGFALGHLTHFPYVMGYPWFLLCFLCVWLAVKRGQWRWTAPAGACVGLLGLIGAVHLLLVLGVLLGTFVAYHTVCEAVRWIRSAVTAAKRTAPAAARRGRMPIASTRSDLPTDAGPTDPPHNLRAVLRPGVVVGVALALGAALAAIQLLPARALTQRSVRQAPGWDFVNMACAHPVRNTVQLIVPFYFGNHRYGYWGEYNYHDMAHYTGALVLLAAIVGVACLGRDRFLWFLVVLAAVGFLIGAGKYLPVYRVLYDWVPGFSQLRNPTRVFWCTDIALACLAAIGVDRTLGRFAAQGKPRLGMWTSVGASVAALVVLAVTLTQLHSYANDPQPLLRWLDQNPNVFKDLWYPTHTAAAREVPQRVMRAFDWPAWTNIAALVAAAIALPLLVARRRPAGVVASAGLMTLLMADLFATTFGSVLHEPHYRALTEVPPRTRWVQEQLGEQRFAAWTRYAIPQPENDDVGGNRPMQFRLRAAHGRGEGILDLPGRKRYLAQAGQSPHLLGLAGVRWLLSEWSVSHPAVREVRRDERYTYYESQNCRPLAYLVRRMVQAPAPERMLNVMLHEQFDPITTAVVGEAPPPETASSRATKTEITRLNAVPGRWELETECDGAAQLVILEGYDPGWRCEVNGREEHVWQTNDQFMSVPVPAGRARVVLEYAPPEFRVGTAVTIVGLLLSGVLTLLGWHRTPTTPSAQAARGAARPERRGRR